MSSEIRCLALAALLPIHLGIPLAAAVTPDRSGVKPQVLSLPTGPGSIEGLGESFEPQLNTGTFTYRIPLKLPPVRGGAPELALSCNSGSGNGPVGLGWSLAVPHVQRQTDKGLPSYTDADTFLDDTGEELVPLADGSFRPENESSFTRFTRTSAGGWRAQLRDGSVRTLGDVPESRLTNTVHGTFRWLVDAETDPHGNRTEFTYLSDAGQLYLREIRYGLHASLPSDYFRIRFDYETNRTDAVVDFRPRFRCETRLRLASVTVSLGERRLRAWRLGYHTNSPVSLLASVTMFGDDRARADAGARPNVDYLPPTSFTYTGSPLGTSWTLSRVALPDPVSFADGRAEIADLDADGLPDLLFERNTVLRALVNPGGTNRWLPSVAVDNPPPAASLGQPTTRLADVRGDGRSKLLVLHQRATVGGRSTFRFQDFARPGALEPARDYLVPDTFFPDDPRVRLVDLDHDRAADLLRIDEGNFARVSLLLSTPAGAYTNALRSGSVPGTDISFASGWQLADMNGDGLQDLVLLGGNDNTWVCLHRGLGQFESRTRMPGGPAPSVLQEGAGAQLVDLDQDGLADLVVADNHRVRIWPNVAGTRWGRVVVISDPSLPSYSGASTTVRFADFNANGSTDIVFSEPNSGLLQIVDLQPVGKAGLLSGVTTTLGRGLAVQYRSSAEFQIAAQSAGEPWTRVAPFPVPVVARTVETDGLGHSYTNVFSYRDPYYDALEREFRGFASATRTELGDDAEGAPTLVTRFKYDTGARTEALKGKPLEVTAEDDRGTPFWRRTHVWTTRRLPFVPAPGESRALTFAFQRELATELRERGSPDRAVHLRVDSEFDDFGNEIRHADWGRLDPGDPPWDDERITVRTFSAAHPSGQARWMLDRVVTEELQDPSGRVVTRRHSFYDDPSFAGDNPGAVSRGNLTLVREWIDPGHTNPAVADRFRLAIRQRFDAFGNVVLSLDPLATPDRPELGHQRSVTFDPVLHTHPVEERLFTANPLALAAGTAVPSLAMTADYDLGLGVMTRAFDFNAQPTRFDYDTFGRLVASVRPGDTREFPTTSYTYRLADPLPDGHTVNWIETRQRESAGAPGTFDNRSFTDGLGRKIQTRTESERPGEVVVSDATLFNARRGPRRKLLPYFQTGTLAYQPPDPSRPAVETRYDALGRSIETHQPSTSADGRRAFARTTYAPLARLVEDEEQTRPDSPRAGAAMRYSEDGFLDDHGQGRLRAVDEIVRLDDDGRPTTDPRTWTTRYRYDRLGQFTGYTDSQGNEKLFRHDALGRKTYLDDPDRGTLIWDYDDAGNVLESRDAKGQVVRYTYDGANRLLTEDFVDPASFVYDSRLPLTPSNRPEVAYFHDVPFPDLDLGNLTAATARHTLGRPAAVWDPSGEEHSSYDARGRVEWTVKRIRDPIHGQLVSFRTGFDYDALDRVVRLTWPDDDFVFTEYDARNQPVRFHGGQSVAALGTSNVVAAITYRASGQHDAIDYGNGVRTTYDYDARQRLTRLVTRNPRTGAELIDFAYVFDDASNIERIEDRRSFAAVPVGDPRRNTQHYRYDDLYRLTEARYGFGAPDDLARDDGRIAYRYDRIGNMLEQSSTLHQLDRGLPVTDVGAMESGGSAGGRHGRKGRKTDDPPGPHALSAIRHPQFPTRHFPYDANGNMAEIDGLKCTWDYQDRLVRVENDAMTAEYVYDYSGRRITKRVRSRRGNEAELSGLTEGNPPSSRAGGYEREAGRVAPRAPREGTLRVVAKSAAPGGSVALPEGLHGAAASSRRGNEADPAAPPVGSDQVTLYIDRHSEVRPGEAFIKYLWNGDVRVARITTQLSPGPRVQRLRLYKGWNLLAPAVGPVRWSTHPALDFAARWDAEAKTWQVLPADVAVQAPIPHWLRATFAGTLLARGEMALQEARTIRGPTFVAAWGFAPVPLDVILPAANAWFWKGDDQEWATSHPKSSEAVTPANAAWFLGPESGVIEIPGLRESWLEFLHGDHLGSTTATSDTGGLNLRSTSYEPFGRVRGLNPVVGTRNPYGFAGQELDAESQLLSFPARSTAPWIGRFTGADPASTRASIPKGAPSARLAAYAWCGNNPITRRDPNGADYEFAVGGYALSGSEFRSSLETASQGGGQGASMWHLRTAESKDVTMRTYGIAFGAEASFAGEVYRTTKGDLGQPADAPNPDRTTETSVKVLGVGVSRERTGSNTKWSASLVVVTVELEMGPNGAGLAVKLGISASTGVKIHNVREPVRTDSTKETTYESPSTGTQRWTEPTTTIAPDPELII